MLSPSELSAVQDAWRALDNNSDVEAYRVIDILSRRQFRVKAGRFGGDEAILFGFGGAPKLEPEALPLGQGFTLAIEESLTGTAELWLTLRRRSPADGAMFEKMAADVLSAVVRFEGNSPTARLRCFIDRVRAWQDFMRKGHTPALTTQEEVGLFGELIAIRAMMDAEVGANLATTSWRGPYDGLHDFVLGAGGIEVKTCAKAGRFLAHIGELDQLDDSVVRPLHLMAINLVQSDEGLTLPEKVQEIRDILAGEVDATQHLENGLLKVGYLDAIVPSYVRRYAQVDMRIYRIDAAFPRLFSGNVPAAISRASYDLDIDFLNTETINLDQALKNCGVI